MSDIQSIANEDPVVVYDVMRETTNRLAHALRKSGRAHEALEIRQEVRKVDVAAQIAMTETLARRATQLEAALGE